MRISLALILCCLFGEASADPLKAGSLTIESPWARATPGGAKVAAGYLRIANSGAEPDRLIGGSAAFAGRVEIHTMSLVDGVMNMRPLPQGLEIRPGQAAELKPGGDHVMFLDLKEPLKQGETRRVTLIFERAGAVEADLPVAGIGARAAPDAGR